MKLPWFWIFNGLLWVVIVVLFIFAPRVPPTSGSPATGPTTRTEATRGDPAGKLEGSRQSPLSRP